MITTALFPETVTIEPTSRCNLSCSYCPRRFLRREGYGYMELGLFRQLLTEITEMSGGKANLVLFHRGESLLHPLFEHMLAIARLSTRGRISLATNATVLTPVLSALLADTVDFLSFSIDTGTGYGWHRGADYHHVVTNIEHFLSVNKRAQTQVSMVRTRDTTRADVQQFVETWRSKVDRVRVYEEHSKGGAFGRLDMQRKPRRPCQKVFNQTVISWDGTVRRCNHDWDGEPLGSVVGSTIAATWKGREYGRLRRQHQEAAITDRTCANCDSWYAGEDEAGTGVLVTGER